MQTRGNRDTHGAACFCLGFAFESLLLLSDDSLERFERCFAFESLLLLSDDGFKSFKSFLLFASRGDWRCLSGDSAFDLLDNAAFRLRDGCGLRLFAILTDAAVLLTRSLVITGLFLVCCFTASSLALDCDFVNLAWLRV